jgi:hypothetical protein
MLLESPARKSYLRCCCTGIKRTGKLIIADGYHRLCAVYKFDEDAMIPRKIV